MKLVDTTIALASAVDSTRCTDGQQALQPNDISCTRTRINQTVEGHPLCYHSVSCMSVMPPLPPPLFLCVHCVRSDGYISDSDTDSRGEFGSDPNENFGGFAGFDQEAARAALEQTN